jgi:antitoxin (DNA-binding transcriptional repressor) of toxin-antitoxin stability system
MVKRQVSKSEFKAKASEFFRQIESSGESLIVTDCGRPILELRPYLNDNAQDPLSLLRGSLLRDDNPMGPAGENDWNAAQ